MIIHATSEGIKNLIRYKVTTKDILMDVKIIKEDLNPLEKLATIVTELDNEIVLIRSPKEKYDKKKYIYEFTLEEYKEGIYRKINS